MKLQLQQAISILNSEKPNPNKAFKLLKPLVKKKNASWPVFHYMAVALIQRKQHQEAAQYLQKALRKGSDEPETYHLLSVAELELANYESAEKHAREALQRRPDFFKAWLNLGSVCRAQAKLDKALVAFQKANQLDPKSAGVAFRIAQIYGDLGNLGKALELYDIAWKMDTEYDQVAIEKAMLLQKARRFDESRQSLEPLLQKNPKHPEARLTLAETYRLEGKYKEAISLYEDILSEYPKAGSARVNYALALQETGRFNESERNYLKAFRDKPGLKESLSNYLMGLHYNPERTREEIFEAHKEWDRHFSPLHRPRRPEPADKDPERTLRIGFLSGSFFRHPVGWMITLALENLPKDRFEIYCYSNNNVNDTLTRRIHAVSDSWKSIVGYSDEVVAGIIREDEVDILVELSGHAAHNRLGTVALEPAPVIVKWVGGLFNTSGLQAMDYLITDRFESPEGEEPFYTEKLVRLPDDYVCFLPPDYAPELSPLPAKEKGYVTFGCFNNPTKVNDVLLEKWAELLRRVSDSRLFLKSKQYDTESFVQHIVERMGASGIPEDRLVFEGNSPHDVLLEAYNSVDIALDPWPYSGGLSTCEALWMGVPVVTLPGPTFAGRHSITHLINAGLPELVAATWDEYVDIAVGLASDLQALAGLRARLRDQVAASSLCDGERFGIHLATAFREMWKQRVAGWETGSGEWRHHITVETVKKVAVMNTNHDVSKKVSGESTQKESSETDHKFSSVASPKISGASSEISADGLSEIASNGSGTKGDQKLSNVADAVFGAVDTAADTDDSLTDAVDTVFDTDIFISDADDTGSGNDIDNDSEPEPTHDSINSISNSEAPHNRNGSKSNDKNENRHFSASDVVTNGCSENVKGETKTWKIKTKDEVVICTPADHNMLTPYVLLEQEEWYEPELQLVRDYLKPGMKVVDVGAGFGVYSLPMAKKVGSGGKVYAIEPSVMMRQYLNISKVDNDMTCMEVSGRLFGSVSGWAALSETVTPELGKVEDGRGDVQMVTLDSWWEIEGRPQLDLVKIDVNGKELEVLQGADRFLSETSPVLVVSTSESKTVRTTMVQFLIEKGFVLFDYIAGVGVLSPIEDPGRRNPYIQNVVALKAERVEVFKEEGWIHNEAEEVEEPDKGYWKSILAALPWTENLFRKWVENEQFSEYKNYYRALDYICAADDLKVSDKEKKTRSRKAALLLIAAQELISKYNAGEGGVSVALTLVRVLNTLGKREQAVAVMQNIMQNNKSGQENKDLSLPFLLPLSIMDNAPIRTDFAKWFIVRKVETWLSLKDHSTYMSAPREKKMLEALIDNPETRLPIALKNKKRLVMSEQLEKDLNLPSKIVKYKIGLFNIYIPKNELFRLKNIFQEQEYCLPEKTKILNDSVIVDIGANIGSFALYANTWNNNARIHCFEPNPQVYPLLKINTQNYENISTYFYGLGNKEETLTLYQNPHNTGACSTSFKYEGSGKVSVEIKVALKQIEKLKIHDIYVLKIDTEGAEVPILENLQSNYDNINIIMLEYHSSKDRNKIISMLDGFTLYSPERRLSNEVGTLKFINNKFNI